MLLVVALLAGVLLVAVLVYPGEGSHLSPALNRWLYDRGAGTYEKKWSAPRFRNPAVEREIVDFARGAVAASGSPRLLDLGCGTGRGARLLLPALPDDVHYLGIDQSVGMLDQFRNWLGRQSRLDGRVTLRTADLGHWAAGPGLPGEDDFGLVLMLEVGEFLPDFPAVLAKACDVVAPGGGLVITRPAGWWWVFFPGRRQSRRALAMSLVAGGMEAPSFRPWRSRYEIVFARRAPRLRGGPPAGSTPAPGNR